MEYLPYIAAAVLLLLCYPLSRLLKISFWALLSAVVVCAGAAAALPAVFASVTTSSSAILLTVVAILAVTVLVTLSYILITYFLSASLAKKSGPANEAAASSAAPRHAARKPSAKRAAAEKEDPQLREARANALKVSREERTDVVNKMKAKSTFDANYSLYDFDEIGDKPSYKDIPVSTFVSERSIANKERARRQKEALLDIALVNAAHNQSQDDELPGFDEHGFEDGESAAASFEPMFANSEETAEYETGSAFEPLEIDSLEHINLVSGAEADGGASAMSVPDPDVSPNEALERDFAAAFGADEIETARMLAYDLINENASDVPELVDIDEPVGENLFIEDAITAPKDEDASAPDSADAPDTDLAGQASSIYAQIADAAVSPPETSSPSDSDIADKFMWTSHGEDIGGSDHEAVKAPLGDEHYDDPYEQREEKGIIGDGVPSEHDSDVKESLTTSFLKPEDDDVPVRPRRKKDPLPELSVKAVKTAGIRQDAAVKAKARLSEKSAELVKASGKHSADKLSEALKVESSKEKFNSAVDLAYSLMSESRWDDAAYQFEQAVQYCETDEQRVKIQLELVNALMRSGKRVESIDQVFALLTCGLPLDPDEQKLMHELLEELQRNS